MWPFKSVPKASPKRVAQLEAELGDVQITMAWFKKQLFDLNARLSTVQREQKRRQDAPEPTNDDGEVVEDQGAAPRMWTPPPVVSTAHLARRFRGG